MAYARSKLKAMLGFTVRGVLPIELLPVERICQRWASSVGTGLPADIWGDDLKSRPPPLDDWTVTIVDQAIIHSPYPHHVIIPRWYRTPTPCYLIAESLGLSERSLEMFHVRALRHLKEVFEASRDLTLLRILRVQV